MYTLELSFRVTQVGLRGLQRNRRYTRSKWSQCKSRLLLPLFSHSVVNLGIPPPPIQSRVCSLSQLLFAFLLSRSMDFEWQKGDTRVSFIFLQFYISRSIGLVSKGLIIAFFFHFIDWCTKRAISSNIVLFTYVRLIFFKKKNKFRRNCCHCFLFYL